MSTLTLPDAQAPESDSRFASSATLRFVAVHVNLLPDEVSESRKTGRIKRYVIIGLGGLLALLLAVYGFTVWQTSRAKDQLTERAARTLSLQHELRKYDELTLTQSQAKAINDALGKVMTGDMQWRDLLDTLGSNAPAGIKVTGISGSLAGAGPAAGGGSSTGKGGLGVLNLTGNAQIGTVTITGTAATKDAVAAYVDALAKQRGLAAPFPASITDDQGTHNFSVNVIITSDALGGRFVATSPASATTKGK